MSEFKIKPFPRSQPEKAAEAPPAVQAPKKVVVITDGACSGNPGPGGWGVILRIGETTKELHGGSPDTTNNRMEITAVVEALNALKQPCDVEIISDSEYVINTQTKGWKRKKNNDLWQALDAALLPHTVTWKWVRGHNGHDDNERADELARMGIAEARQGGSRKSVT